MAEDGFNAYQIKKYAGHRKIETAAFYVELSQKGFEDAIRSKYGGQVKQEVLLKPKRCWGCGQLSQSHAALCSACGRSLDSPGPGERERKMEVLEAVLQAMRERNPEFDRMVQEAAERAADKIREIVVCSKEP